MNDPKDPSSVGGGAFYGDVKAGRDIAGRDIHSTNVGASPGELAVLFQPIRDVVNTVDESRRGAGRHMLEQIEAQAEKGKDADDSMLSKLVDGFVGLIPEGVGAIVSAFASPLLGAIAGPATRRILARFTTRS